MTIDSIDATWKSYCRGVLPPDAPRVQLVECRRAFYAGFYAMLQVTFGLTDPDLPDDLGAIALLSLEQEAKRFKRDVLEGRA
jgi:hypothetical protein